MKKYLEYLVIFTYKQGDKTLVQVKTNDIETWIEDYIKRTSIVKHEYMELDNRLKKNQSNLLGFIR